MADLWQASTAGLSGFERQVAIKTILPEFGEDPEFVRLFLEEAKLAARLHHRGIVQVFEVGFESGVYFFAMEYLKGLDLRRIVTSRNLPVGAAIWLVSEVAEALHHAHEVCGADGRPLDLVHRDIKPSNLFVCSDGAIKVLDFGIARVRRDIAATVTQTGVIRGTYAYMSPEQVRAEPLDRRSDIFSLGTVLYELSTGIRLFHRDSEYEMLNSIVSGDVPHPTRVRSQFPRDLEAVILRTLRVRPGDRFATAAELASALREVNAALGDTWSNTRMSEWLKQCDVPQVTSAPSAAVPLSVLGTSTAPAPVAIPEAVPPPRRRWIPIAVAAAALAAAFALWFEFGRSGEPVSAQATSNDVPGSPPAVSPAAAIPVIDADSPTGPVHSSSSPASAPAPSMSGELTATRAGSETTAAPALVELSLQVQPSGATVRLDGAVQTENPLRIGRSDQTIHLQVEATGHTTRNIEIKPDRDQTIVVALERKSSVRTKAARPRKSTKKPRTEEPAGSTAIDSLLIRRAEP